jgi:hypothetical protein
MTDRPPADSAALRLLRADLDQLGHHLSELDRGTLVSLRLCVAELLERIAGRGHPGSSGPPAPHHEPPHLFPPHTRSPR